MLQDPTWWRLKMKMTCMETLLRQQQVVLAEEWSRAAWQTRWIRRRSPRPASWSRMRLVSSLRRGYKPLRSSTRISMNRSKFASPLSPWSRALSSRTSLRRPCCSNHSTRNQLWKSSLLRQRRAPRTWMLPRMVVWVSFEPWRREERRNLGSTSKPRLTAHSWSRQAGMTQSRSAYYKSATNLYLSQIKLGRL